MINGLEGIPGSGKSYEASVYHVLPALQAGRKVITNLPLVPEMFAAIDPDYLDLIELRDRTQPIRGTWDANRKEAFQLFPDGEIRQPADDVPLFGHVWDYYTDWKHPDSGLGPLFIIDECHVALPTLKGGTTDKEVVQWFKLHRHFNVDVLLCTQSFRDVNDSIRGLLGVLVKVRKADILGKADHYIRKVHGGYRGGLVSQQERKYKPDMFRLYRSHTQGNSVAEASASDVSPFLVKFNRFKWAWIAASVIFTVYAFWPEAKPEKKTAAKPAAPAVAMAPTVVQNPLAASTPAGTPPAASTAPQEPQDDPDPEPFSGKLLHLTGMLEGKRGTLYTFAISMNGQRISTTTSAELLQMGYRWKAHTACAGTLRWGTKAVPITCDAPQLARGTEEKPVVIAVPAGTTAPIASSRDKSGA